MTNKILYEKSDSILENEKLVLDIVQEYLNKNRTFNKIEIIPYINSRVAKIRKDLNINGICEILKSLVQKNIVIEGSKLSKYNILLNQNRKKIYEYIINNPGIYFNLLVNSLNISVFSMEWHLNILLKFNFIRMQKIDKFDAYYDFKLSSQYDEIFHIILRDKCKRIIQFLKKNNEGYSKNSISKELNIHINTITKYIQKLEDNKLIIKKQLSNTILYYLNEEYYEKLLKVINLIH